MKLETRNSKLKTAALHRETKQKQNKNKTNIEQDTSQTPTAHSDLLYLSLDKAGIPLTKRFNQIIDP
jgi:hypothetical protein